MCPVSGSGDGDSRDPVLAKLRASRAAVASALETAVEAEAAIDAAGDRIGELLSSASRSSASGLQSKAVAARALAARIDRAVAPSAPLLAALRRVSSLARATDADADAGAGSAAFVERVDRLRDAIEDAVACGDEAVRKVEEAVGFLGRTGSSKAAGKGRVRRLTEAASALRAVYEAEAEQMRFEGPLDDALLRLQDLFEALLLRLKHAVPNEEEAEGGLMEYELGTEEEVHALARMASTLAANDCLDICVDIYVKARYRRAAKAMMRLDPAYLKAYTADAIDGMEWEALESAMALWSPHFHVAVASVLSAERRLCARVMGGDPAIIPPAVWPECFAKIAARIAAAFFRFADGVAAAAREPQRLFKLLDMADAVAREGARLDALFSSEPETATLAAIRERAREVGSALARAAAAVFYEFGLRVETHGSVVSGAGASADVPKIVRYAVNYLKCLASDDYRALMDAALRAGAGDGVEGGRAALAEAASSVLEALHRHVEAARRALMAGEDAVAGHVMAMNAYWYIYMRARGTDLARLVGEDAMKRRYKSSAEEAAWEYQDAAWTPLVRILSGGSAEAREKAAAFAAGLEERARRHGKQYKIPDADLRAQIRVAVTKAVRAAYAGFVKANEKAAALLAVDVIESKVGKVFDEMGDCAVGLGLGVGRARTRGRRESRGSGNLEGFDRD